MPRKCCVIGCRSNYNSQPGYVTVFSLPRGNDSSRRASWIDAIARPDYPFTKHSGVCILHFPERQIIRSESFIDSNGLIQIVPRKLVGLTKDAVPSLALGRADTEDTTPPTNSAGKSRKPKALKESPAPQPKPSNALENAEVLHVDRIIREDRLNGFNELQNSFRFRLQKLLNEEKWTVKLERDNYLLFYKIFVPMDTFIPRLTSVCVKNDMSVKVSCGADRIIDDFMQLRKTFNVRAGYRVERWCEIEELLKSAETHLSALQLPVESVSPSDKSELVIERVESPVVLVQEAMERLQRAAELLDNDVNRLQSVQLEFLSEQAGLAMTKSKRRRRYGERVKRLASLLYARSPRTYRLLRDLKVLSLPFEPTAKKRSPPLPRKKKTSRRQEQTMSCSLPVLAELLQTSDSSSVKLELNPENCDEST